MIDWHIWTKMTVGIVTLILSSLPREAPATDYVRCFAAASPSVPETCLRRIENASLHRQELLDIGKKLERLGRFASAVKVYDAAIRLHSWDPTLHRAKALAQSNLTEQQWLARRRQKPSTDVTLSATAPAHSQASKNEAVQTCHQARGRSALHACRAALAADPNAVALLERMGDVQRGLGLPGDAVRSYDRALTADPTRATIIRKRRALLSVQTGSFDDNEALTTSSENSPGTSTPSSRQTRESSHQRAVTTAEPTSHAAQIQLELITQLLADGAVSRGQFEQLRTRILREHSLERAAPTESEDAATPSNSGRYHAVLIGNDRYRNYPRLRTAVADIRAISKLLSQDFSFKVTEIENASHLEMTHALESITRGMASEDSLVIYFAGHGVLDARSSRGYWLPSDAQRDNSASWISDRFIIDLLGRSPARHVMVIADSCFSGSIAKEGQAAWLPRSRRFLRRRTGLPSGRSDTPSRRWGA